MEDPVRTTSLLHVAESLRTGATGVREHTDATLRRIADVDRAVRAFVDEPERTERLRAAARDVTDRHPAPDTRPALYGVPVGVKDILHVDGLPTRAGSTLPVEELADAQGTAVARLLAAGALIAGKTVTAEFAVTAPGPTRNPHDLDHTPGGSSSGSAAAVAAGLVPLALGTQTIASLIRPAAYCGVVGYKPTHGRIPTDGVLPTSPSYDTVGTFTATAADAALAASVLCDDWRPERAGAERPVLAVPVGPYLGFAEPEARTAFDRQVTVLRDAGYEIREIPVLDDFEQDAFSLFVINLYELARAHADLFDRHADRYDPRTAEAILQGRTAQDSDYADARKARADFRDRLDDTTRHHGVDLWITPAATGPAPRGLDNPGDSVMSLPWSGAGLPVVTVPAGRSGAGLPLGLQCVGAAGEDERLLRWAQDVHGALTA
ncbi:amidase [Streptomyces sp. NPDC055051]